jgi:hypothetical protein
MTKKQNESFEKVVVVSGIFVSLFGGIFAAAVAIDNFKNYNNPYLFGFVFGTIGLLIGLFVAKKLKSEITKIVSNIKNMQQSYFYPTFAITSGCIGLLILFGEKLNTSLSTQEKCDNYFITEKIFSERASRRAELNVLVINVDGTYHRIITKQKYWQNVSVGEQINACNYKSKIGFDYIELTNEN